MKRVLAGAASALALLFILLASSCIVTSSEINVDLSCDKFAENDNIRNDFNIEVGDKIRIKLCADPAADAQWSYETIGPTILKEEDHDFEEPAENVEGATGKDVWTFEAVEKGSTEIQMEYVSTFTSLKNSENPEWESTSWKYTFTVKVE